MIQIDEKYTINNIFYTIASSTTLISFLNFSNIIQVKQNSTLYRVNVYGVRL